MTGRSRTSRFFAPLLALAAAAGITGLLTGPAIGQSTDEVRASAEALTAKIETFLANQERARREVVLERSAEPPPTARLAVREFGVAELASLLERLEIGMSALAELGDQHALEQVQRVASEVRKVHAAASAEHAQVLLRARDADQESENDEIRTVRRRLKVMRAAVDAFLETGREGLADRVERAMHTRELAIEGRRDAEATRIRESAPDRRELAELLAKASELWREWGDVERAQALAELSEVYAEQWQRRRRAQGGESERPANDDINDLGRRVAILRMVRAAFAEAGNERLAGVLEGTIHYGELTLEDASPEVLEPARERVPGLANLAELSAAAANMYREWGNAERARACATLSDYYRGRLRAESTTGDEIEERERRAAEERQLEERASGENRLAERENRLEILRVARAAHREAGNGDAVDLLERTIHLAELQLAGAGDEALAEASQGLSMPLITELVQRAGALYREWNAPDRAEWCEALATFYIERDGIERATDSAPGAAPDTLPERRARNEVEANARTLAIIELVERIERVEGELREIKGALRRLVD